MACRMGGSQDCELKIVWLKIRQPPEDDKPEIWSPRNMGKEVWAELKPAAKDQLSWSLMPSVANNLPGTVLQKP